MQKFVYPSKIGCTKAKAVNDCSIRALANTGLYSYEEAELHLKKHGKKTNRGCTVRCMQKVMQEFPLKVYEKDSAEYLKREYCGKMTLLNFILKNPSGIFLLAMQGHAAVINDGKLIDTHVQPASRIVYMSWQIQT